MNAPTIAFGKHKGKLITELDTGYLDWLIRQNWLKPPLRDQVDEELCERMERGEYTP